MVPMFFIPLLHMSVGVVVRASPELTLYPAISPLVRVVGRTAQNSTSLYFDWSSVQIHLNAVGPTSVLLDESLHCGMASVCNQYAVFLGPHLLQRLNTSSGVREYPVLLAGQAGLVRIEKITEASPNTGGVVRFDGVRSALLKAPRPPLQRRVECIGDSMMCGAHSERGEAVGSWQFNSTCSNEKRGSNENSYLSWCPTLARALGAEYQMECQSGNGLVFTDNPLSAYDCHWGAVPPDCPVMPHSWKRRLMCTAPGVFMKPDQACSELVDIDLPLNNTDMFLPHAVIINLGQNDFGAGHTPTYTQWLAGYRNFLHEITSTYASQNLMAAPRIQFFLACGGMANLYCNDTRTVVQDLTADGLFGVHYLDVTAAGAGSANNGTEGCPGTPGSHPSSFSHEHMAALAEPVVRQAMGWNEITSVV